MSWVVQTWCRSRRSTSRVVRWASFFPVSSCAFNRNTCWKGRRSYYLAGRGNWNRARNDIRGARIVWKAFMGVVTRSPDGLCRPAAALEPRVD